MRFIRMALGSFTSTNIINSCDKLLLLEYYFALYASTNMTILFSNFCTHHGNAVSAYRL